MSIGLKYSDDLFVKTSPSLMERVRGAIKSSKKIILVSAGVGVMAFGMDVPNDVMDGLKNTSLVKMFYADIKVKSNDVGLLKPLVEISPHQQYLNKIKRNSSSWPNWHVGARDHKMSDKVVRDIGAFFIKKEDYFMALASQVEGMRLHSYKDPAYGINIGFGYNITARANNSDEGRKMVISELEAIGIDSKKAKKIVDIATRAKKGKESIAIKEIDKIGFTLTPKEALGLLKIIEVDYREAAKKAFDKGWDDLNDNQKATLTYLAYQTGESNLYQYKKLKKEIAGASVAVGDKRKELHLSAAQKNIETYYVSDGEFKSNERAKMIMQGMFDSVDSFMDAVGINVVRLGNLNILNKREAIVANNEYLKVRPKNNQ